jgi:hypothetical protein
MSFHPSATFHWHAFAPSIHNEQSTSAMPLPVDGGYRFTEISEGPKSRRLYPAVACSPVRPVGGTEDVSCLPAAAIDGARIVAANRTFVFEVG